MISFLEGHAFPSSCVAPQSSFTVVPHHANTSQYRDSMYDPRIWNSNPAYGNTICGAYDQLGRWVTQIGQNHEAAEVKRKLAGMINTDACNSCILPI
jgi:hypothetical protein